MRTLTIAVCFMAILLAPSTVPALAAAVESAPCAVTPLMEIVEEWVPFRTPLAEECTGAIRPGAAVYIPRGWLGWARCSLNWVADGADANVYVGTAGHCGDVGQRVYATGVGDFGTIAAGVNGGVGNDWAWIRVDADKERFVDAALCRWGGPVKEEPASATGPALQYGWGTTFMSDAATRARPQDVVGTNVDWPFHDGSLLFDKKSFRIVGAIDGGDSGSGIMSADGAPYGIVTHGLGGGGPYAVGFGTTFEHAVTSGEAALGTTLTLRTTESLTIAHAP